MSSMVRMKQPHRANDGAAIKEVMDPVLPHCYAALRVESKIIPLGLRLGGALLFMAWTGGGRQGFPNNTTRTRDFGRVCAMEHIHAREYLDEGDLFIVSCEYWCNVLVMDDSNYATYNSGGTYHYRGGYYKRFPARIPVPSSGFWNVVIDFGGDWPSSSFHYGIQTLKRS